MKASKAQVIATVSREVVGFLESVSEMRSLLLRCEGAMATFNSLYKTIFCEYVTEPQAD